MTTAKKPTEDKQTEAKAPEKKVVTFTKPSGRYSRGDVAGFAPAEAARLVKINVAVAGTKLPVESKDQDDEPKA